MTPLARWCRRLYRRSPSTMIPPAKQAGSRDRPDSGWDAGYTDMQLWTHESHLAACALYARTGWTLTDSKPVRSFGRDLVEQTWRIRL